MLNKIVVVFAVLLWLSVSVALGQLPCDAELTIEQDTTICLPSDPIQLIASFGGEDVFDIEWTPATGLSSTSSLTPTASVTETTTYTLTIRHEVGDNLVFNGDFALGNTGFTTEYMHSPTTLWPESVYAITDNPNALHPNFANCGDISGEGNVMAVNGAGDPGTQVWCQTIAVSPNTEYNFSAWLANLIPVSPAIMQFSADGVLLGPPFSVPGVCIWDQFNASWFSGAATSVEICIVNQNTDVAGNDFALDEIRFRQVCEREAEVTITVLEQVFGESFVTICPDETYFAGGGEQTESGVYVDQFQASNGCDSLHTTHLTVLPEIPTTIIDTVICAGDFIIYEGADLGESGSYEFPFVSADGCDSSVVINLEVVDFAVGVSEPNVINCINEDATIEVFIIPERDDLTIFWSTDDGNIVDGFTENVVTVDAPGTYTVEVFYENANITCGYVTADIEVLQDTELPILDVQVDGELDCNNPTVTIDASSSSGGDVFVWEILDGGDIIEGLGTSTVTVNGGGEYQLTLTNSDNGCEVVQSFVITGDPGGENLVVIDSVLPFTCTRDTTIINAEGTIIDGGFAHYWFTDEGDIIEGEFTLSPTVGTPGWYFLVIEENSGQCADTTAVWVGEYLDSLDMEVVDLDTITCAQTTAQIDIQVIGDDPFSITWTNSQGDNITAGNNGLTVEHEGVDTLTVMITNEASGCVTEHTVIIPEDRVPPNFQMGPDTSINCLQDTMWITSVSPDEAFYTYNWTTNSGHIADGHEDIMPAVTEPGTYLLTVVDTRNGCSAADSILVSDDRTAPDVQIEEPDILNCILDSIALQGLASSVHGPNNFVWTDDTGTPIGEEHEDMIYVSSPGEYRLIVTDSGNGCRQEAIVTVLQDIEPPIANAGDGFTLNCLIESFTLDGSASSMGSEFTHQWTTQGGNFVTDVNVPEVDIDAPGTYVLTVTNTENGCTASDSVEVMNDDGAPDIVIADFGVLNCMDSLVIIDATSSSSGPNIDVIWQTTNGNISDLISTYIIEVDEPGQYILELFNQENDCRSTLTIDVIEDREAPTVLMLEPLVITCDQVSVSPNTDGISEGSDFSYEWSSEDGHPIGGQTSIQPTMTEAGVYTIQVTNTINHCVTNANLTVTTDTLSPNVVIQEPDTLTCAEAFIQIDGSPSDQGADFDLEWSTVGGQISGGINAPFVEATSGGTYTLTITNQINGCVASLSVELIEDRDLPDIQVASTGILSCAIDEVSLVSSGSSSGDQYEYLWSTSQGSITSSPTEDQVLVADTGWYQLLITNVETGCAIADSVPVTGDFELPTAIAGPDDQFNCETSVISLNGQASANGQPVEVLWTTENGRIDGGADQLNIMASASGVYVLTVTNLSNGCVQSDQLTILPDDNDFESVEVDVIQPDCDRSFGIFELMDIIGGTPPFDYNIVDGNGEAWTADALPPGQYNFEINDQVGCSYRFDFEIIGLEPITVDIEPLITIELGESVILEPQFNLAEEAIEQIIWDPDRYLSCANCPMPEATPPDHIQYNIHVFDINGCQARATTQIRVIRTGGVYAPNAFTPGNADGINDFFTIYSRPGVVEEIELLEVYDRWGNNLFSKTSFPSDVNEEGWDGTFNGQAVNPGIYVYRAEVRLTNNYLLKLHGEVNVFN